MKICLFASMSETSFWCELLITARFLSIFSVNPQLQRVIRNYRC